MKIKKINMNSTLSRSKSRSSQVHTLCIDRTSSHIAGGKSSHIAALFTRVWFHFENTSKLAVFSQALFQVVSFSMCF